MKENAKKDDTNTNAIVSLDQTDRKILQLAQDDFPIVQEPWLEISNRLSISEAEVISRLERLLEAGAILKIGPTFDSSKIGLKAATLVALRIPKSQVEAVASIINQHNNVSHNYEREDEFNVWFTLAAPSPRELAKSLDEDKTKTTRQKRHDILDSANNQSLQDKRAFSVNIKIMVKTFWMKLTEKF